MHADGQARILDGMQRTGVVLIMVLALFGLADSAYLAEHAANGVPLFCDIGNLSGCNVVAASQYSQIFGVPLAVYGVFFYSVMLVLAVLELSIDDRRLRRILQGLSLVGVLSSLYFIFIQVYLIGAFCIYCFASALIALFILVCAGFIEPLRRGMQRESLAESS